MSALLNRTAAACLVALAGFAALLTLPPPPADVAAVPFASATPERATATP